MNEARVETVSRRVVAVALCGIACLWAASAGFAQPPSEHQDRRFGGAAGPGHDRGGGRLVEFLELSEAQEEEWKAVHEAHRDATALLRDDVRANREATHAAIESDSPDPTEVGALVLAGYDLREQIKASAEALQEELKAILTPDQLDRYEAFQAANGPRRRGPRGDRGRGSRGPRRGRHGAN